MKRWIWIALAAAGLAALAYALFFRTSDEDQMKQRLVELSEAVRVAPDGAARRATRIQKTFERVFAPRVDVELPDSGEVQGREELAALAISSDELFRSLELRFDDVRVRLGKDARGAGASPAKEAVVDATATLTAIEIAGGSMTQTRRVELHFEKLDGWQIRGVGPEERRKPQAP